MQFEKSDAQNSHQQWQNDNKNKEKTKAKKIAPKKPSRLLVLISKAHTKLNPTIALMLSAAGLL